MPIGALCLHLNFLGPAPLSANVGHCNMRLRRLVLFLAAVALLGCAWLLIRPKPSLRTDLSVTFVALTNDPGASAYTRLSVISDGSGPHALFAVSNISQVHYVQFGIVGIQKLAGDGWRDQPSPYFQTLLGVKWRPGLGCYYTVPWPAGLDADTPWRLKLWVKREPVLGLRGLINQRFGRELFPPWGHHVVTSSVVRPMRFHGAALETHAESAQ